MGVEPALTPPWDDTDAMTEVSSSWSESGRSAPQSRVSAFGRIERRLAGKLSAVVLLVVLTLAGLPLAVWLDLRHLSETSLRGQANDFANVIENVRSYYASNVVSRVLEHGGNTEVLANYHETPGAIPIPATLSLELGTVLGDASTSQSMRYRFFSDYPFAKRTAHSFDTFEAQALAILRERREASVVDISGSVFDRRVRLVTPILMAAPCVACHNTHPDSPKKDWKVGDVRGIEEFTVSQPIAANIFAFKYLVIYFGLVAAVGVTFICLQQHQASMIAQANRELGKANQFLASVAQKIAKYLSPSHYRSIFSGEKDVIVATERKKLTIFFSDIVGFTAATDRLQPEELTGLLNEYLTQMSLVASNHGGTVNKFIGDAILVFFGDLDSRGVEEDARACVRMAFDMQECLAKLNVEWRKRGVAEPFRARMGIHTGYCNVGNFGSEERMDYTIIGAEANLAARLQSIAEPGRIVLSYETFVLVEDLVQAHALEPIALKGISREVVPYAVDGRAAKEGSNPRVIAEHAPGLDLFLDLKAINSEASERIRRVLENALTALDEQQKQA